MLAQAGNAIVEFAFIAPILIVLTLGTIELGRYAYFSILVSNAARAGAAYGSMNLGTMTDDTGISNAIAQDSSPNPIGTIAASPAPTYLYACYDTSNAALATPFPVGTVAGTQGCSVSTQTPVPYVQVTATGSLKPLFALFSTNNITVQSTVYMRVQCLLGTGVICK